MAMLIWRVVRFLIDKLQPFTTSNSTGHGVTTDSLSGKRQTSYFFKHESYRLMPLVGFVLFCPVDQMWHSACYASLLHVVIKP